MSFLMSLTKQKIDLEWIMKELGIPFRKQSDKKSKKKPAKIKVKMPHANKKILARKRNLVQTKNKA